MTPERALAWVKKCGVAVESGHTRVPSLAQTVAGEPVKGSWWGHAKGKEIFRLSRAVRRSRDVLICRLVDGKITYVHRRLWPALVRVAAEIPKSRLAAVKEAHTTSGKHMLLVTPFSKWVPKETVRAAHKLTPEQAAAQLSTFYRIP